MFCIESLEKKGHRDLLQSRKSLLLFRRTTFLLIFYHLHALTSHSLGIKTYIQKWSYDKIKWRTPKRVVPPACFHALIPTDVKESPLRDLGDSWRGSKPQLLGQVLGKVSYSCRSWSSLGPAPWRQLGTEFTFKGEEPCWPALPKKITAFRCTKITFFCGGRR